MAIGRILFGLGGAMLIGIAYAIAEDWWHDTRRQTRRWRKNH